MNLIKRRFPKTKQIIAETRLKAEKKQKYFYWGGLGLLAILSFLGYRNFQNQKKSTALLQMLMPKKEQNWNCKACGPNSTLTLYSTALIALMPLYTVMTNTMPLYLNKFARLLRNILDSSKLTTVSFTKDIDTLKLYVELEELRHENKFKTVFSIDDELLNHDYKVPALIIQPFVENAILHGLKTGRQ